MADYSYPYVIGLVKSVKLESCTPDSQKEFHEPTFVIYVMVTYMDAVQSEETCSTEQQRAPRNGRLRFKVPVRILKTSKKCNQWIMGEFWSAQLKFVAAENENPRLMLTELIWSLKEKWEAGEMWNAVIEMNVTRVTETRAEHRRRAIEAWVNEMSGKFVSSVDGSGTCCAVCLDNFDEKSVVLKLPCRHVFHNGCIGTWLTKKRNCPCCRNLVKIGYGFWVHKKNSAISDLLLS